MQEIKNILDLNKSTPVIKEFEETIFDCMLKKTNNRVIVFGTGNLGKNIVKVLRENNIQLICACDNDKGKWNTYWNGLEILSPRKAIELYGNNTLFIVAVFDLFIWDLYGKKDRLAPKNDLERLGCKYVIYYPFLFWKFGKELFKEGSPSDWIMRPSEIRNEYEEILDAYNLFESESKKLFLNILKSRLYADEGWNVAYVDEPAHFDSIIHPYITSNEVFVDCGAFNGDTLEVFLKVTNGNFKKYFAIEPMVDNGEKISKVIQLLSNLQKNKIEILQCAVGEKEENLFFRSTGKTSIAVEKAENTIFVRSIALDNELINNKITWIKMDIEGAEILGLLGAQEIIRKYRPKLTICVYHRSNDLWKIPLLINKICNNYKFYLKRTSGDIICYAIPE